MEAGLAISDLARQYPPGQEKALGGQDLAKPYPPGKELAITANASLAVMEVPGREKAK